VRRMTAENKKGRGKVKILACRGPEKLDGG
jgi:hypothetical protein